MGYYKDDDAFYVVPEPNLEKVKDRLELLTGFKFKDLGNMYAPLWRGRGAGKFFIEIEENFNREDEDYNDVELRDYPTYIFANDVPNIDEFDAMMRADPVLKAKLSKLIRKGDPIPEAQRHDSNGGQLIDYLIAIGSDDLDGVAAWLKSRFDVPLERYESNQWGPYYRTFERVREGRWQGDWRLWINDNPMAWQAPDWSRLSEPDYPEYALILFMVDPPYADQRAKTVLEDAPFDAVLIRRDVN